MDEYRIYVINKFNFLVYWVMYENLKNDKIQKNDYNYKKVRFYQSVSVFYDGFTE